MAELVANRVALIGYTAAEAAVVNVQINGAGNIVYARWRAHTGECLPSFERDTR